MPYVNERDHLGQLIDSDARPELGGRRSVKKLLVKQPVGKGERLEVREDIPRRWLEQVGASEINTASVRASADAG